MSVKDKPQVPISRVIANILFLLAGLFFLANILLPIFSNPVPQVPYSFFIDQVENGKVARASVGQN